MKKILCPTDFSDAALNAIAYAADFAKVIGADLTLLNVQSLFDIPNLTTRGKETTVGVVFAQLEAQAQEVTHTFGISCNVIVEPTYRKLSTVINKHAGQYELIVMGSNGADDFYKFFSGSNTFNTIIKTKTPLLLIPANYAYREVKTIVYAYNYLRERKLPLYPLATFANLLKAKLVVLQVMEESISEMVDEELAELQMIIRNFFSTDIELHYDTIRSSAASNAIHEYFLKSEGDVLALCSRHTRVFQRIFHKSVVKHITAISGYPVFIFH